MDSILIFGLALILFGPRKLPEIGRQIGKIVFEFRKASNEFKMQIEDELRASEQAERQKKIAEETAALTAGVIPIAAALTPETSTPSTLAASSSSSTLTVQPPSVGEQVSTGSPYTASGYYTEEEYTVEEPLAAVIVDSPGEDPNPDAIAEIYPMANFAPPATGHAATSELEMTPLNHGRETVEAPIHESAIEDSAIQIHNTDRHTHESREIDQATTHHG